MASLPATDHLLISLQLATLTRCHSAIMALSRIVRQSNTVNLLVRRLNDCHRGGKRLLNIAFVIRAWRNFGAFFGGRVANTNCLCYHIGIRLRKSFEATTHRQLLAPYVVGNILRNGFTGHHHDSLRI